MHTIVNHKDLTKHLGLKKLGLIGDFIAWLLIKIIRLDFYNQTHHDGYHLDADDFLQHTIDRFGIDYTIPTEDLEKIPKQGPFIVVGNHPIGGADGIVMMRIIRKIRKDFCITGNFILHQIKPLKPIIFPVNPFENRRSVKSSKEGLTQAVNHLKQGYSLGFYPAGEVSKMNNNKEVFDKKWSLTSIKIIKEAGVPVIPMYCHAKNSFWFYLLGKLNPAVQTILLPRQSIRKGRKPIKMFFGDLIPYETIAGFESLDALSDYLRNETYGLKNRVHPN